MTEMENDLYAVTYLSHSLIKSAEVDEQCSNIESVASKANAEKKISGMLLFCRNRFIQRLEGPREAVEALVEVIKADKRHRNFTTLSAGLIKKRAFEDWSHMAVITKSDSFDDLERMFINLEAGNRDTLDDMEARYIINFIQHYK